MKAADAYQVTDCNTVLRVTARHRKPVSDDLLIDVRHRTTRDGRSALLTRQQAASLRDWLTRWIEEGWDGTRRTQPGPRPADLQDVTR